MIAARWIAMIEANIGITMYHFIVIVVAVCKQCFDVYE
jgi:hypothetical protein